MARKGCSDVHTTPNKARPPSGGMAGPVSEEGKEVGVTRKRGHPSPLANERYRREKNASQSLVMF